MTATALDYQRIFDLERTHQYPIIDDFEQRMGYAIDRAKLEEAARVIEAAARRYYGRRGFGWDPRSEDWSTPGGPPGPVGIPFDNPFAVLDIGTAKSFSALCLLWALNDAGADGSVTSVDVIDPYSPEIRNTVAELSRPLTLHETLEPWPEAKAITFVQSTGINWLKAHPERLHIVFVDGKHKADVVSEEAALILARQVAGDLCIFDDVHLPEIRAVVRGLHHSYSLEYLDILPNRGYAVGVRK